MLSAVHGRLTTLLRTRIMACMTVLLLGGCATCGILLVDAHQQARRDAGRAVVRAGPPGLTVSLVTIDYVVSPADT